MKLTHEEMREAWKSVKIWRLHDSWIHSQSGRVFILGTAKHNWCEEMDDRFEASYEEVTDE